jgi:glutamate-1-semialdehyde 2,1-aminomutase
MIEVELKIKTDNTRRMLDEAKNYSPAGVIGDGRWYDPFPLFIKKTLGSRIWDVDDNEFIDYHGSYGPAVLGYNDPRVRQAVIETLENEGVLSATPHPKELELTKLFTKIIPGAQKTILCGGGGSDPMYNAIRVVRAYTGKMKVLKFEGGYHGWHDYLTVSVRPKLEVAGPADEPYSVPISLGSLKAAAENVVVAPFHNESAVERIVKRERDQLAAIVIEPGYSGGCPVMRPSFVKFLRQICDQYGIVLIFDEVVTGFRTHLGGAGALLSVTPDLGVFGKAMANGFPISALTGKNEIMSLFMPEGPVFFQGTYNGQVLGVAAALKTIELLSDGQVHKKLWRLGDTLTSGINAVIDELELDARCYNFGSIWGLYFTRKPLENYRDIAHMVLLNKDNPKGYAMKNYLMNNGVFVTRNPRGFISAAHSDEEIDKTVDVMADFLRKYQTELR